MKDLETSFVGLSVAVETDEDGSEEIGLVIHTKDEDNSFVITLPPERALDLARNLARAATGVLTGHTVGDLIQ